MPVMRCSLPEGGELVMAWPDNITVESVEMAKEMIALQLRAIQRIAAAKSKEPDNG